MAIGERFRSGGAHGIARFLAEHQGCDSGFDVRRDEQLGSGKLSITCEGCGARVEYRAAEAGELAAGGIQAGPVPANGAQAAPMAPPAAVPPASGSPTEFPGAAAPPPPGVPTPPAVPPPVTRPAGTPTYAARRGSQPTGSRSRGVIPSWVSVAVIGALILGGLTMIAIGLTKDDSEPAPPAAPSGQAPVDDKPGRGQSQAPAPAQNQQPAPAQNQQPSAPAPAPAAGAAELNRRTFANRFTVGVPAGWRDGRDENGGITLTAPGSTAEIVIFFQQGAAPEPQLAQGARGFLAERHRGAQVGGAKPVRIGSEKGMRIVATYQGGEEIAVVLSAGGFSHVILRRVDRGASPDLEQQADASLASFNPR